MLEKQKEICISLLQAPLLHRYRDLKLINKVLSILSKTVLEGHPRIFI